MHILTFDVEEWFHLLDFDATRTEDKWDTYEVRIHDNVDRVFRILDETDTKATFFIIGLFHPIVIKSEYYFGVKSWWAFLVAGIVATVASLLVADVL